MSGKGSARDILERMRAVAVKERPRTAETEASASVRQPERPSETARRVRYTVDLDRDQHRFLRIYAIKAGVDASVVIRSLLQLLQDDPELSSRVQEQLQKARTA